MWGTYLGGGSIDFGRGIAAEDDRFVVTGWTGSTSGISTPGTHQFMFRCTVDAFLASYDRTGAKQWCS